MKEDARVWACGMRREAEKRIQGYGGKTCGKRSPRGHRHCWEDIEVYLKEIGSEGVGWVHLAQERAK